MPAPKHRHTTSSSLALVTSMASQGPYTCAIGRQYAAVLLHAGAGNSKVGPLMPPKMPAPHTRAHEETGHGYHIFCIARIDPLQYLWEAFFARCITVKRDVGYSHLRDGQSSSGAASSRAWCALTSATIITAAGGARSSGGWRIRMLYVAAAHLVRVDRIG